jgi:hypothetical protein
MRLIHSFNAFLKNHVNLNQTRVDKAKETSETLTSFVKNAEPTSPLFMSTAPQGSIRQGTIIKPRTDETEFDVDLLLRLKHQQGWSARNYLDVVEAAFLASDRYKDMVNPDGNRCVTIEYVGDFHVDVVPSVEINGQCWIMNHQSNQFELTDGDGYANWFSQQNAKTNAHLAKVVRLAKYLRDHHAWEAKSILLTTLLGRQVSAADTATTFPDVPTTLFVLTTRLDAWLQGQL